MMLGMIMAATLAASAPEAKLAAVLPSVFSRTVEHYLALEEATKPVRADPRARNGISMPNGYDPRKHKYHYNDIFWWTSGHLAGDYWLAYEATGDERMRELAEWWTKAVLPNSKVTDNHDIGFIMMCSCGNAARLLKTDRYDSILCETAASLVTRFREDLGQIQSWDSVVLNGGHQLHRPVIIDNMMNLELLEYASKHGGGAKFDAMARSHAKMCDRNHFRSDDSVRHVVDYRDKDASVYAILAGQGMSALTAWSRGQSWAIYGFTVMYRETRDKSFLARAIKSADYAIDHPSMPADGIPLWDYGAAKDDFRDSSAASVMASALLELSTFVEGEKSAKYRSFAVKQLLTLASDEYFSKGDEAGHFLIKHAVSAKPYGIESCDISMDYADYYFLEGLLRFRGIK